MFHEHDGDVVLVVEGIGVVGGFGALELFGRVEGGLLDEEVVEMLHGLKRRGIGGVGAEVFVGLGVVEVDHEIDAAGGDDGFLGVPDLGPETEEGRPDSSGG